MSGRPRASFAPAEPTGPLMFLPVLSQAAQDTMDVCAADHSETSEETTSTQLDALAA